MVTIEIDKNYPNIINMIDDNEQIIGEAVRNDDLSVTIMELELRGPGGNRHYRDEDHKVFVELLKKAGYRDIKTNFPDFKYQL